MTAIHTYVEHRLGVDLLANPPAAVPTLSLIPEALTIQLTSVATVVDVIANDTSTPNSVLALTAVGTPSPNKGAASLVNGRLSYDRSAGTPTAAGDVVVVPYTVSSAALGISGTSKATITTTHTPPISVTAVADALATVEGSSTILFDPTGNDVCSDGLGVDLLTVSAVPVGNGTGSIVSGIFNYTPPATVTTSPTEFDLTVTVGATSDHSFTATSNLHIAVYDSASAPIVDAPLGGQFYGQPLATFSQSNNKGFYGQPMAVRLLCTHTGIVDKVNWENRRNTKGRSYPNGRYSDGYGGIYTIYLYSDLNGKPNYVSGQLGKTAANDGRSGDILITDATDTSFFVPNEAVFPTEDTWTFTTKPSVVLGKTYWLVWVNTDNRNRTYRGRTSGGSYSSVQNVDGYYGTKGKELGPWYDLVDSVPWKSNDNGKTWNDTSFSYWGVARTALVYQDGTRTGPGLPRQADYCPIGGQNRARMYFKNTYKTIIAQRMWMPIFKDVNATGLDDITVELRLASDNSLISSHTIIAGHTPPLDLSLTSGNYIPWTTFTFNTPKTLSFGVAYYVYAFSPGSNTTGNAWTKHNAAYGCLAAQGAAEVTNTATRDTLWVAANSYARRSNDGGSSYNVMITSSVGSVQEPQAQFALLFDIVG